MNLPRLFIVATAGMLLGSAPAETPKESRDSREMAMAERAVLMAHVAVSSEAARRACPQTTLACCGQGAEEIALALVAAKRSPQGVTHLVALLRFRLDGAVSESHTCYVLERGRAALATLRAVRPSELVAACREEVAKVRESYPDLDDLQEGDICNDEDVVRSKVRLLISAIEKSRRCSAGDY